MTQNQLMLLFLLVVTTGFFVTITSLSVHSSFDHVDSFDFSGAMWLFAMLFLTGGAFMIFRVYSVGAVEWLGLAVLAFTWFKPGTSAGEYVFAKRREVPQEPWKGPGTYLFARHTEVIKLGQHGHAIAPMEVKAISVDRVEVTVTVSAGFSTLPDGVEKDSEEASLRKANADVQAAYRAILSAKPSEIEAATTKYAEATAAVFRAQELLSYATGDLDRQKTDHTTFWKSLLSIGHGDKLKGKAATQLEQAVRDAVGEFFALDCCTGGREVLRGLILEKAKGYLAPMKIDLKGVVLGATIPEDTERKKFLEHFNWGELEVSMGSMGLAKHRVDELARAGIVVLPTDPSLYLAANGQQAGSPGPGGGSTPSSLGMRNPPL